MSDTITQDTTLAVTVTVQQTDGTAKNLTGATLAASLGTPESAIAGTVTPIDLPAGQVRVTFPAPAAFLGLVTAELRVTISGETQSVWRETFRVQAKLGA